MDFLGCPSDQKCGAEGHTPPNRGNPHGTEEPIDELPDFYGVTGTHKVGAAVDTVGCIATGQEPIGSVQMGLDRVVDVSDIRPRGRPLYSSERAVSPSLDYAREQRRVTRAPDEGRAERPRS